MAADEAEIPNNKHISRLKIAAIVMTAFGICLFAFFIYSVGVDEILSGIGKFGLVGFVVILAVHFLRICVRSFAWKLSVHAPQSLRMRDTVPAVVIGEAMSSTIPLGILISGTTKAIAVRTKIPLVAGLSSVATENLFYSLVTGLFLIAGGVALMRGFALDPGLTFSIDIIITLIAIALLLGVIMVVRQWHFASSISNWLYGRGFLKRLLHGGRAEIRKFEDLIYGFYREHPGRFLPICIAEAVYHMLGVAEVWYIVNRISGGDGGLMTAFLLESISRLIAILFKLIPFMIGVDEAGAQFVGETVALATGVGVTLAIIRKGRILFWTAIGWAFIVKRGVTFRDATNG